MPLNPHGKKILMVSHYYPPHMGGIEFVVQRLARGLADAGNEVCVVTSDAMSDAGESVDGGARIVRVRSWNPLERQSIPFPFFSWRLPLILARETARAEVVHIHDVFYLSSLAAAISAYIYKKPLVVTQHVALVDHPNILVRMAQKFVYATYGKWIFGSAKVIFTYNGRVDEYLVSLGVPQAKIHAAVNGVDHNKFYPANAQEKIAARKYFNLSPDKKIVLFVGRYVPKKGFDRARAAAGGNYQMVFAGGESKNHGLDNMVYLGKLPQAELANLYRAADVFLLPSRDEGFPLSAQEAMATGLPVILGDDSGYERYGFSRDLAVFLKNTGKDAVRDAVERVINDEELLRQMGKYSHEYARGKFDWKAAAANLENIYHKLLTKDAAARPVIVTTSWDDGHVLDLRLAGLLKKYGIKGTFYVAPEDIERRPEERLTASQIRKIAADFEIGGHTISHRRLPKMPDAKAQLEISESKKYLEKITGRKILSFCYPGGEYRTKHARMASRAGYIYARTVKRHSFSGAWQPFEAQTTINAYNHFQDLLRIIRFAGFNPFLAVKYLQWDCLAAAMFDRVAQTGGEFHLWGHSWEIDEHGDWDRLERVLAHIAGRENVIYATNGELPALRPKRLLLATPYFLPDTGGVQTYAAGIARQLQAQGWQVVLAAAGRRGLGFGAEAGYFEGMKIFRLPYWFKISNTPINPLWFFTLRRIAKKEAITIINAHAPVPFFAEMAGFSNGSIPLVLTYHAASRHKGSVLLDAIISFHEGVVLPALIAHARAVICSSDFVREGFLANCYSKSVTVAPGVDINHFAPEPRSKRSERRLLFTASLGRAEKYKGLETLLEAQKILNQKYGDLMLIVAGDGDMRDDYQEYANFLGIGSRVVFRGKLLGRNLLEEYQKADVFVLPSAFDSSPTVIMEAMACGLPVVSTRVGGIPALVGDGMTGYLVDAGDAPALAQKIEKLLDDPELAQKMGRAGREKAAREFDWAARIGKYREILEKAWSGPEEVATESEPKPVVAQITGYYPPHLGGMETVAEEISKELFRRGYQVQVFTAGRKHSAGDRNSGPKINRLATIEVAHTPFMPTLFWRLLRLPKGSVFHVHISPAGLPEIATLAARLRGARVVAHVHLDVGVSGKLGFLLPYYKKYLLGPVLRAAARVVVFSEEQSRDLQSKYRIAAKKIAIVPNGVGHEYFVSGARKLGGGEFILVYAGRLGAQKRVDRAIEAMSRVKVLAKLIIAGDGELMPELQSMARDLKLKNVEFLGRQTKAELIELYRRADAFLILSDIEGMPLAVLEAMASGLPVIASNVPGNAELVANTGILVSDIIEAAKAIEKIAADPDRYLKLSQSSLEKAGKFSWEETANKLEAVYMEALNDQTHGSN